MVLVVLSPPTIVHGAKATPSSAFVRIPGRWAAPAAPRVQSRCRPAPRRNRWACWDRRRRSDPPPLPWRMANRACLPWCGPRSESVAENMRSLGRSRARLSLPETRHGRSDRSAVLSGSDRIGRAGRSRLLGNDRPSARIRRSPDERLADRNGWAGVIDWSRRTDRPSFPVCLAQRCGSGPNSWN